MGSEAAPDKRGPAWLTGARLVEKVARVPKTPRPGKGSLLSPPHKAPKHALPWPPPPAAGKPRSQATHVGCRTLFTVYSTFCALSPSILTTPWKRRVSLVVYKRGNGGQERSNESHTLNPGRSHGASASGAPPCSPVRLPELTTHSLPRVQPFGRRRHSVCSKHLRSQGWRFSKSVCE